MDCKMPVVYLNMQTFKPVSTALDIKGLSSTIDTTHAVDATLL